MALENVFCISKGGKKGKQAVHGVIVNKMNGEYNFNYNTAKDPAPEELEVLKDFRNRFVAHLEVLNDIIGELKD